MASIKLTRDGRKISEHAIGGDALEKAIISALGDAGKAGPGSYAFEFPKVVLPVRRQIVRLPIGPPSAPEIGTPINTSSTSFDVPLVKASSGPIALARYELEISTGQFGPFTQVASGLNIFGTGVCPVTQLNPATTYFARAIAFDTSGRASTYSATVQQTTQPVDTQGPNAPGNVSVVPFGNTKTDHTWTEPTDPGGSGLATYEIHRGLGDGNGNQQTAAVLIDTIPAFIDSGDGPDPNLEYRDEGPLTPGQEYFYRHRATDVAGNPGTLSVRFFVEMPVDPPDPPPPGLIESDGFESGNILPVKWTESNTAGAVYQVLSGGAPQGNFYLRTTLNGNGICGRYRAELTLKQDLTEIDIGDTRYYAFSMRVPTSWINDSDNGDTVCQFHHTGDPGNHGGHYALRIQNNALDLEAHTGDGGGPAGGGALGGLDKGQWNRFVFMFVWQTGPTGSLKVWKNPTSEASTPVHQANNIRTVGTGWGPGLAKMKIGIYKPKWRCVNFPSNAAAMSPRVIEHDNYKTGTNFGGVLV